MSKRPHAADETPPAKRPRDSYDSRRHDRDCGRRNSYDRRESSSRDRRAPHDDRRKPDDRCDDRRRGRSNAPASSRTESGRSEHFAPPTPILPDPLPPLPKLSVEYAAVPFRHKSTTNDPNADTYEPFEFKGDAVIEVCAADLLFENYRKDIRVGEMSQLRELLVKNETLAEYSRAYGLDKRIKAQDMNNMQRDSQGKGNKGMTKIIADVFEAYVAAAVCSAPDRWEGMKIVDRWLRALWAPRLEKAMQENKVFASKQGKTSLAERYDENARPTLQQRIIRGRVVNADYRVIGTKELRGDKLGQNEWTVELWLTAEKYGIPEPMYLATGKGRNKQEANNWAAVKAMHGQHKRLIDDLEERVRKSVEERKAQQQEDAVARIGRASVAENPEAGAQTEAELHEPKRAASET